MRRRNLACGLEVGDEVISVLLLLKTIEGHLGTGNVLLGVLEVLKQSVLVPGDALVDVGVGVGEAGSLSGLATEEPVKIRSDLVRSALLDGVALKTSSLEEGGTLFLASFFESHCFVRFLSDVVGKKLFSGRLPFYM